jgi:hypothetical protein
MEVEPVAAQLAPQQIVGRGSWTLATHVQY